MGAGVREDGQLYRAHLPPPATVVECPTTIIREQSYSCRGCNWTAVTLLLKTAITSVQRVVMAKMPGVVPMIVPKDGTYDIIADTAGSNIDTTLSVYPPGRPNPVSNDNNPDRPGPASRVAIRRVALKVGQRISVAVDGVNGAEGRIRISVRLKPAK